MLSSLVNYYDRLAKNGLVIEECFSEVKVNWLICLNEDGTIDDILEFTDEEITTDKKGKQKTKKVAKKYIFPKRAGATTIRSESIEHRSLYIFGIDFNPKKEQGFKITDQAKAKHNAFVKENLKFTEGINSPLVLAYRAFIENWVPEEHLNDPVLLRYGNNLSKNEGYAFCLSGNPSELLNDSPEILERAKNNYYSEKNLSAEHSAQCSITGELGEIAETHDKINGLAVIGGMATGSVFVCFKNPAEQSYTKSASFNSNISKNAMIKYTSAMNYLLSNKRHRIYIENMALIYWADSEENDDLQSDFFSSSLFDRKMDREDVDEMLNSAFEQLVKGKAISEIFPDIDENVTFYIMGMTPNSSRVSVKMYYKNTFGNIMQCIAQHQRDMSIDKDQKPISINQILRELKSPKASKGNVPSPLVSDIFRSILYGVCYPEQLLEIVVRRVKTDSDEENNSFIKLNRIRAGIIKACLNRKSRFNGNKEEITMALDTTNTSQAYLCGRLFAKLEAIQQKASGNKLNKTIKDSYFASACSTPALVFPRLIKLSQNHLAKIEGANSPDYFMGEIINQLGNTFPKHLSLSQQGEFILGYYHERFYKKTTNKVEE